MPMSATVIPSCGEYPGSACACQSSSTTPNTPALEAKQIAELGFIKR